MKTTTLFFAFLFLFFYSSAQDEKEKGDSFFFKTELDSSGICYGKCLIQAKWDTIPERIIIQDGRSRLEAFDTMIIDTIYTDYFILKKSKDISVISEYIDTNEIEILISGEWRRSRFSSSLRNNYTILTESKLFREEHLNWINKRNKKISNEWELKSNPPIYKKIEKKVIDLPGNTREEIIPPKFKTIIAIQPKENIKSWQLKSIDSLCNQFYLKTQMIQYTIEKGILDVKEISSKVVLLEKASISLRKIHEYNNSNLLSLIQKQLFFLGFYKGNFLGELNDEMKEAIINYQIKNKLPIGQLDEETVRHISERKTPFNK